LLLLTGATGYFGAALCAAMKDRGIPVRLAGRSAPGEAGVDWMHYDMAAPNDPSEDLFAGVSCVIHSAGLAHRQARAADYQSVNVEGTSRLAAAAAAAGVAHFIYLSSLNVVPADACTPDAEAHAYREPEELYAASKWRAEQVLQKAFGASGSALTVVRPGLIYDEALTANLRLVDLLMRSWPALLPAIGRRSMVARPDLVELIISCAQGISGASGGLSVLTAIDGECYDAEQISRALSTRSKLGVTPQWLCKLGGRLLDWRQGNVAGTTWRGLSSNQWCGTPPEIEGWQARLTLASCRARKTVGSC
jgi:UDP-glucose 4-epimerase